jgi:ER membrane protein complex subunit 1
MLALAFSNPTLARTSFLLTHAVRSLGVTVTERGVTERALLLGLASGRVVEVSHKFLDGRRPIKVNEESAEEHLLEYRPLLSFWPSEAADLLHTEGGLVSSPIIGRESSCHLAAFGTDIAHTVLTPAGKFDDLSDDFNYAIVASTVLALAIGVVASRAAAQKKVVDEQWT